MLMSPIGLRPEKGCAGDAQQKLKTTDQTSCQRGCPIPTNLCLKIIKERRKIVHGSQMGPDTKTDWQTDHQS
jgi:hypothetical protein